MAKEKKIVKKESPEQDEFQTLALKVRERVVEDPRRAAMAAGGVVAVILVVLLALYLAERSTQKRIAAAGTVVSRYLDSGGGPAADPSLKAEMEKYAERYSGSEEGGQVRYFLAGLLAAEGDYEAAADSYRKVVESHSGNSTLSAAASMGLAYAYKMLGENEKAMGVFRDILQMEGVPVSRSLVELEIAQIHQGNGDTEQAAEIYRRLAEQDPDGAVGQAARQKMERLGDG